MVAPGAVGQVVQALGPAEPRRVGEDGQGRLCVAEAEFGPADEEQRTGTKYAVRRVGRGELFQGLPGRGGQALGVVEHEETGEQLGEVEAAPPVGVQSGRSEGRALVQVVRAGGVPGIAAAGGQHGEDLWILRPGRGKIAAEGRQLVGVAAQDRREPL